MRALAHALLIATAAVVAVACSRNDPQQPQQQYPQQQYQQQQYPQQQYPQQQYPQQQYPQAQPQPQPQPQAQPQATQPNIMGIPIPTAFPGMGAGSAGGGFPALPSGFPMPLPMPQ